MHDSCLSLSKFKLENTNGGNLGPLTPFSGTVIRVDQQEKITQLSDNENEEWVHGRRGNP